MNYYQKQNPFTKSTIFANNNRRSRYGGFYYDMNQNINYSQHPSQKLKQSGVENPFEKSTYDTVFNRRIYQSQNKDIFQDQRPYQNILPLSKYQTKLKLKQLDTELWKRQKQKQQRYKLENYGPQALRYTNYNTSPYLLNIPYTINQHQYYEDSQQIRQESPLKSKLKQKNKYTPQSQYMLDLPEQRYDYNNNLGTSSSNTLISKKESKFKKSQQDLKSKYNNNNQDQGINKSDYKRQVQRTSSEQVYPGNRYQRERVSQQQIKQSKKINQSQFNPLNKYRNQRTSQQQISQSKKISSQYNPRNQYQSKRMNRLQEVNESKRMNGSDYNYNQLKKYQSQNLNYQEQRKQPRKINQSQFSPINKYQSQKKQSSQYNQMIQKNSSRNNIGFGRRQSNQNQALANNLTYKAYDNYRNSFSKSSNNAVVGTQQHLGTKQQQKRYQLSVNGSSRGGGQFKKIDSLYASDAFKQNNMYSSDYINQNDGQKGWNTKKGPLDKLKFSSSFSEQSFQKYKDPLDELSQRNQPKVIYYNGIKYFKIDLL